ncbi:MAG: stage 0 sporulation family protein [Christensenella sp.]
MSFIIGVRFDEIGKIYYFDPGNLELVQNDNVVVETARGMEFGTVVFEPREVSEQEIGKPLKKVLRKADEKDQKRIKANAEKEKEAIRVCNERIEKHKLDMKLINVEYTFDGSKIIFCFTAEGRVDFRDLVKDLASVFKTRIELRQIGVRDEAKKIGGLGPCGRACCCSEFLGDFQPVSIKMAKEQNLSLSPTKISGLCGRLMCCLNYEQEHYHTMRRKLPRVGHTIKTPQGEGLVVDANVLTEKVKVKMQLEDGTFEYVLYTLEELKVTGNKKNEEPQKGDVKDDAKESDKEIKSELKQ